MKNSNRKPVCKCQNIRTKTGFLSTEKIKSIFRLNQKTSLETEHNSLQTITYIRTEQRAAEIEAELKRESARIYINTSPIR